MELDLKPHQWCSTIRFNLRRPSDCGWLRLSNLKRLVSHSLSVPFTSCNQVKANSCEGSGSQTIRWKIYVNCFYLDCSLLLPMGSICVAGCFMFTLHRFQTFSHHLIGTLDRKQNVYKKNEAEQNILVKNQIKYFTWDVLNFSRNFIINLNSRLPLICNQACIWFSFKAQQAEFLLKFFFLTPYKFFQFYQKIERNESNCKNMGFHNHFRLLVGTDQRVRLTSSSIF